MKSRVSQQPLFPLPFTMECSLAPNRNKHLAFLGSEQDPWLPFYLLFKACLIRGLSLGPDCENNLPSDKGKLLLILLMILKPHCHPSACLPACNKTLGPGSYLGKILVNTEHFLEAAIGWPHSRCFVLRLLPY